MGQHVCPWWGGYFIDNRLRRWVHNPDRILAPLVGAGMTALDFGCGMGMFAIAMARLVGPQGRVIAVDLQQPMLDVMLKRAARQGVAERIHAHRCAATSVGWSEPVDFALAFYSAHEVPDLRHWLGEMHGCLRPAGSLLVVEPKGHVRASAFAAMLALAAEIGLTAHDGPKVRFSQTVVFRKK